LFVAKNFARIFLQNSIIWIARTVTCRNIEAGYGDMLKLTSNRSGEYYFWKIISSCSAAKSTHGNC